MFLMGVISEMQAHMMGGQKTATNCKKLQDERAITIRNQVRVLDFNEVVHIFAHKVVRKERLFHDQPVLLL